MLLAGCRMDPNEDFIQGIWSYEDPHLLAVVAEQHLTDQWIFDRGTFQNNACCFSEVYISGNYHITKNEGDHLVLELYNLKGDIQGKPVSRKDTLQINVVIHSEDDTLEIGRGGPYIRLNP